MLLATLFRLALDVSATRLILTQGHLPDGVGSIVPAFGAFVVRGNIVVGLIVFAILITIQFIVIATGAQRVAEVSARFTLDAMPGKQMAIDADVHAGVVDAEGARRKRARVQREADFYAAMDGAGKFVKGDAIAALVIVALNLAGGLVVGIAYHGMSPLDALQTFAILSIGNALVTTLPAFLISTVDGPDGDARRRRGRARRRSRRATRRASRRLAPRPVLDGRAGVRARVAARRCSAGSRWPRSAAPRSRPRVARRADEASRAALDARGAKMRSGGRSRRSRWSASTRSRSTSAWISIALLAPPNADALLDRIGDVRRALAAETGIVIPGVRLRDDCAASADSYAIRVRDRLAGEGRVRLDRLLAVATGAVLAQLAGRRRASSRSTASRRSRSRRKIANARRRPER